MDKFANAEGRNCYAEEYVTVQSCIDSIKGKDVFVVATANDIGRAPDSLIRHGRFDISLEIKLPGLTDTEQIIRHYLSRNPKVDVFYMLRSFLDDRFLFRSMSGRFIV